MTTRDLAVTIDGLAELALVNITAEESTINRFGYAFRDERWFIGYANGVNDDASSHITYTVTLTSQTGPRPPDGTPPDGWPAGQEWPPPWTVRTLEFATIRNALVAHIVDTDIPGDRLINDLRLSEGGGSVTLIRTEVVHIHGPGNAGWGFPDADFRVTLGAAPTRSVELAGGDDVVITGTGFVRQIATGGGADRVAAGPGAVGLIDLGNGDNLLEAAGAGIAAVVARGGADRLTAGAGAWIGSVSLGAGADSVTLTDDARIESLRLSGRASLDLAGRAIVEQAYLDGPAVRVTLKDDARILQLRTGEGTTRLATEAGHLDSYTGAGGSHVLAIGRGGAGAITVSGAGALDLAARGFVGMVQVPDAARARIDLWAGADQIRTGSAADRVTVVGDGFVGSLRTGAGADLVTLGAGGAGFVDLGEGDDLLHLAPSGVTVTVTGGAGADTAAFARFAGGVAVSLAAIGTVQDVAIAGPAAFVALSEIEHLSGSAAADRLTGRETANRLTGGAGADTLAGLAGDDTLIGGRGNDSLIGGPGADRFVFGRRDGFDRIADFEPGLDVIAIAGVTGLGQIGFADTAAGVRLSAGETRILVEGLTAAELREADNFVF
jgi:Ca2+-binding RTX toxin-like protein